MAARSPGDSLAACRTFEHAARPEPSGERRPLVRLDLRRAYDFAPLRNFGRDVSSKLLRRAPHRVRTFTRKPCVHFGLVQDADDVAADLVIEATCVMKQTNNILYEFNLSADGQNLVRGRAAVVLDAAALGIGGQP